MSERRTSDDDLPQGLLTTYQANKFPTGALPTPRHLLAAARPFEPKLAPLPRTIRVPSKLDYWGNNRYGVCVSSEEAFAKACHNPEIFIDADTVINFARQHGWLNGAYLTQVMDQMIRKGFQVGNQLYNDGPYQAVNYGDADHLRAGIDLAPVKVAIDHNALPSGAGNHSGWYAVGGRPNQYPNTDHCVGLSSQGTAGELFDALKVALPSRLDRDERGYLLFTWSTQGFVDQDWVLSTLSEAWARNPTTVGVPPLPPEPGPGPGPNPPPPPPNKFPNYAGSAVGELFGETVNLQVSLTPVATEQAVTVGAFWDIVSDIQKIAADIATDAPMTQLIADIRVLAADLGILPRDVCRQLIAAGIRVPHVVVAALCNGK